jgi:hypothetical protein
MKFIMMGDFRKCQTLPVHQHSWWFTLFNYTFLHFKSRIGSSPLADTTSAPQPSDPGTAQPAPLQYSYNRAFVLSAFQVTDAVKRGQEFATKGKTVDDLRNPFTTNTEWTRGKSGKSKESYVVALSLYGSGIQLSAFNSTRLYDSIKIPEGFDNGGRLRSLSFEIYLQAVPYQEKSGILRNQNSGDIREANEEETKIEKVIITDDKGDLIVADSLKSLGEEINNETYSWDVTHEDVTSSTANAHAYNNTGGSVSAYGNSNTVTDSTQTFREAHLMYSASYIARFLVEDKDGKPLIAPDAKKLTVRIISPKGEQDAEFELSPKK